MVTLSANIVHLFHRAAEKHPERTAIVEGANQVTYAQFQQQVQSTASWLAKKGIRRGDRVLVFIPMSIRLYRIVLAIFHIGATAVFLDEWVSKSRMELCCSIADCQGFVGIFKTRVFAWFSPALRRIPIRLGATLAANGSAPGPEVAPVTAEEVALITFTTGSTGTPKAAKRTHGFLRAQFEALLDKMDPRPGDVGVTILPIVLLINLGVGATSVIVPYKASKAANMDTRKLWDLIQQHRINRLVASPFFVSQLALFAIEHNKGAPSITKVFTGGAPVFPDEAQRYIQAFPEAETEIVYGSTEAEPISSISATTLTGAGNPSRGLAVGRVYRGAKVRIIPICNEPVLCESAEAFNRLALPTAQVGEIVVAGAHVLTEYFNNDEALRRNKIFVDGMCWHRTGDSGFLAENGMLYLTGRCSMLINHSGTLISPFVCEYRLRTIPGISCGTLIQWEDKLIAVLESEPASPRIGIKEGIRQLGLPAMRIHWMKKIPRDPRHHSKIDYEALLSKLARGDHGTNRRINSD